MVRAIALALALALTGVPALAHAQSQAERTPEREAPSAETLAREAVEKLVQALSMLLRSLPQYEMPEINDDGDIIIRRVRPRPEPGPTPPRPLQPIPEDGIRT